MRELGGNRQQVRLGLVTVLVGDELDVNRSAIRSNVAVGEMLRNNGRTLLFDSCL